ncbi:MAG: hypothetical protein LBB40_03190 [Holophagales bacterium]|jgi:hypothetical protein|nr:hypothetical protein [Holophagales bacterium]
MFPKYIAVLLLAAISTYLGHALAEGLVCNSYSADSQVILVASDDGIKDMSGHHHGHGMSCDQWLCNGFSGVILVTEAVVPVYAQNKTESFAEAKSKRFYSRTIKPHLNPPRI